MELFQRFWQQHPALLYGLALLLGIAGALYENLFLVLPALCLLLPLVCRAHWLRAILAGALMLSAYFYVLMTYQFPSLPPEGATGTAELEISSLSSSTTHFGKRWLYRGTIRSFESGDIRARNIPFTLSLPQTGIVRPPADTNYVVEGKLKEVAPGYYAFSVPKDTLWYPVQGSWSLAELRYRAKQSVSTYIAQHITNKRAATFLAGIATGDFDDREMQFEFGRFGLQHIMAISGFHFAIIAAILSGLLRIMFSRRLAHITLIFLLSSYFLFLGCGPSIMRAWVTILIALGGYLIEKQGSGINSLGVALLFVLIVNPLLCLHMGFQFSFVTTAAILLLYPSMEYLLQQMLPKRRLSQMSEMNRLNQHAYLVLVFFRQAFALTIAVNLIALPMMLYYFHQFPLLSLLYNLFFPFLVSFSMLLLILAMLGSLLSSSLGDLLHAINQTYTQFVLNFTYNLPTTFDVVLRVPEFSLELLLSYLCIVFIGAICLQSLLAKRQQTLQELAFI